MTDGNRLARTGRGPRLLAVGELFPPDLGADEVQATDITYLAFADVTADALARLRPEVILAPLVGPDFDCLDLAERLSGAGFHGRFRAVAPKVPDPALVRREIAERFPALDFDLLVLDDDS